MGASDGSKMLNCKVKHYEPFIGYKEANITVSDLRTMKSEVDARIAELTAEVEAMAKWIVNRGQRLPDHGCALCVPGGEMATTDWTCAYHLAIARNALKEGV